MQVADQMVTLGLTDVGYEYLNIDECVQSDQIHHAHYLITSHDNMHE